MINNERRVSSCRCCVSFSFFYKLRKIFLIHLLSEIQRPKTKTCRLKERILTKKILVLQVGGLYDAQTRKDGQSKSSTGYQNIEEEEAQKQLEK